MSDLLTRRYQQQIARIGARASARVASHWLAVGHDEANIADFEKLAGPVLNAAKTAAVRTAGGYYSMLVGRRVVSVNPADVVLAPEFRLPFISYWQGLKNGHTVEESVISGWRRAANMTVTHTVQSGRHTADVVLHRQGLRAGGWTRLPDAGACDWCEMVADQTYSTLDAASFTHGNNAPCNCTPVPNIE